MSNKSYTLITGGASFSCSSLTFSASDGIGAEFAKQYAAKGRNLILVARRKEKLDELRQQILKEHGEIDIQIVTADLAKIGAAEEVFKKCKGYAVSTLINNAGQAMGGAWEGHSLERIRFLINLNIQTPLELTSLFLPQLKEFARAHGRRTKEGGVLMVSSTSAFQAIPYMASYSSSKVYLLHFTESLHDEMAERCPELRVSCVCPGVTKSSIWEKNGADESKVLFPLGTVQDVVRDAIRGLEKGQAIMIPGYFNFFAALGTKITPRFLARKMATRGMGQSKRAESEMSEEERSKLDS